MIVEALKKLVSAVESIPEDVEGWMPDALTDALIDAKKAIAEAEKQEPVAMQMDVIVVNLVREGINKHRARELAEHFIKHTTPQQRTWVGLTDEDRQAAFESLPDMLDGFLHKWGWLHFSKAIEAKLKEKNT
jgi:hypothetical protein